MRRNIVEPIADGWEAKLIDRYFLAKLRGLNEAQKRHNAEVYSATAHKHRIWSGIGIAGAVFASISNLVDWNLKEFQSTVWILVFAAAWFHYSGRVEQLFLGVIEEIDEQLAADPDAQARFAREQTGVDRDLAVQAMQQKQRSYINETESMQGQLQSLHNNLAHAIARGDHTSAGMLRGDIAKLESQLRSRGS